jgi:hypothetical protein
MVLGLLHQCISRFIGDLFAFLSLVTCGLWVCILFIFHFWIIFLFFFILVAPKGSHVSYLLLLQMKWILEKLPDQPCIQETDFSFTNFSILVSDRDWDVMSLKKPNYWCLALFNGLIPSSQYSVENNKR